MPGFATTVFEPLAVTRTLPSGTTGFPDLGVIGKTAFYGLYLDVETGRLTIDLNLNGTDLVDLPISGDVRDNPTSEYQEWIWTNARLKFSWGGNSTDHLYMEVI